MKRIFFILALAVSFAASAQGKLKFEVTHFEPDPFDTSARDPQFRKADGSDNYAIIKVTSDNPDDDITAYQFNFGYLNHEIVLHDDALWVYVQKNARNVTIRRNGYVSKEKYDLGITTQPGAVYRMTLSSEQPKVKTQMVHFQVTPIDSNAIIFISNVLSSSEEEEIHGNTDRYGSLSKNLPYGTYTYRVISDNYYPSEGTFTLNQNNETLEENISLRARFAKITLKSAPEVTILVNDENMGTNVWTGNLRSGKYTVECRKTNHLPSFTNINIEDGNNQVIDLPLPTPILGTISLTSSPPKAEIYLDGEFAGLTPKNIETIIGKHFIELRHKDFDNASSEVNVLENVVSEVDIELHSDANPQWYPEIANSSTLLANLDVDDEKKSSKKKVSFYGELGLTLGYFPGVKVLLGMQVRHLNLQFYDFIALSPIDENPDEYAPTNLGISVGWTFNLGKKFTLTPQLSAICSLIDSADMAYDPVVGGALELRTEFHCSKRIGLSLTPGIMYGSWYGNVYATLGLFIKF